MHFKRINVFSDFAGAARSKSIFDIYDIYIYIYIYYISMDIYIKYSKFIHLFQSSYLLAYFWFLILTFI